MLRWCDFNFKTPRPKKCIVEEYSMDEIRARVAVRYFIKKSKRFDSDPGTLPTSDSRRVLDACRRQPAPSGRFNWIPPPTTTTRTPTAASTTKSRERTRGEKRDIRRKRENRKDDFQFPKPTVYECDYCSKILFHRLVYRRHMIRHIKRHQRCARCNQCFHSKIASRRHQLICRR